MRLQDSRTDFAVIAAGAAVSTFAAMSQQATDAVDVTTFSRWVGVLGTSGYRVEVPANWNGRLVMCAHGFAGNGNMLSVSSPSIRRYLIQNGYAWAASSYSKNYYDVRAGIEDTNALALESTKIAAKNGRVVAAPAKTYITGVSMGGHITAAAIEDEGPADCQQQGQVRWRRADVRCCGRHGVV